MAVLIATVGFHGRVRPEGKQVRPAPAAPGLPWSRPVQQPVTDYLYLTGNTQAVDQVQLDARVEGFLSEHPFQGRRLREKGRPALPHRAGDATRPRWQQADGQLAAAQAQLLRAGQEYDRQVSLLKQNATAKSEVEKWKAWSGMRRKPISWRPRPAWNSPASTSATRRSPSRAASAAISSIPATSWGGQTDEARRITRTDRIYVYFTPNERDLLRFHRGPENRADIGTPPSCWHPGRGGLPIKGASISSPPAWTRTGTILVRAVIKIRSATGVPTLVPGLFARLRIPTESAKSASLVPERALGVDQVGPYLLGSSTRTSRTAPVTLGASAAGSARSCRGSGGDRVVVSGIQRVGPAPR